MAEGKVLLPVPAKVCVRHQKVMAAKPTFPKGLWKGIRFGCSFAAMNANASFYRLGAKIAIAMIAAFLIAICTRQALGLTQDETDFPQGYDAVTAAPGSHRVIFENALVRDLKVTMPPPGKTEPMYHHHWPGFFPGLGYRWKVAPYPLPPTGEHCQRRAEPR